MTKLEETSIEYIQLFNDETVSKVKPSGILLRLYIGTFWKTFLL